MMRLMVCTAELVCRVENTRWPVSATTRAASMVSRSRISPISTMSGSWRSTCLSDCAKLWVSEKTSRWFTRQPLCSCTNSIGSSTVTMCSCRSRLILSIMAASVVLLPLPVGPVTRTSPRGRLVSSGTDGGRPRVWSCGVWCGIMRKAPPTAPFWR